jgi:uncharacterized protein DUF4149
VIVSLWFGSAAFLLFVAAPAAFRASDSSTNAANVVGAMLGGWHYIALIAPLALLAIEWRRARGAVIAVVFAGVLFAATEAAIDLQIRALRASSPVPITALQKSDPLRRRFGMLHGVSSLALIVQVIIAAAATIAIEGGPTQSANRSATQTS